MADLRRTGCLRRRLAAAFLTVSLASLAVLFVGTVVPHLIAMPADPDDAVSEEWLLAATAVAVLTAVVLSTGLARRLTRPVDGYVAAARAFAAGDHSVRPADLGLPEFDELTRALTAAADEIERSETARRQLTTDIAHELRTPLAALQAGLEELRDGFVSPDPATLAALHAQATRMGRVVNDLAALAAAQGDGFPLQLEAVDLPDVVSLAVAAWRGSLEAAGIELDSDLAPGVTVVADSDRLHQIVGNLMANAALYCRPGDRVTVRVRSDKDEGLLEVADTGPGFREEDLPYVFDRTWRAPTTAGLPGSGLGLPIVRALALSQHGKAGVESVEGHGATITIRLPLSSRTSNAGTGH